MTILPFVLLALMAVVVVLLLVRMRNRGFVAMMLISLLCTGAIVAANELAIKALSAA